MGILFAWRLAAKSLLHDGWINLLSILTIGIGLLFTAIMFIAAYNVDLATRKLPEKFSMTLYLKSTLSQKELDALINIIKDQENIESVKYISKYEALRELEGMLKDTMYVLEGIDENPLPDSLELKLKDTAVGPDTVKKLSKELRNIEGIDEIEYGEKFLSTLYAIKIGSRIIAIVFIILTSVGMIFVCYSTVKILFYRKKDEFETYKLLGATKGFIRMPFLIEGSIIGLSGGIVSLIGVLLIYFSVIVKLRLTIPLFNIIVFPTHLAFLLPFIGFLIGMTGAALALGRIKY